MFNHRDHELERGKKASPTSPPFLLPSTVSRVINAVFGSEGERAKGRVDPINVPYILVFLSSSLERRRAEKNRKRHGAGAREGASLLTSNNLGYRGVRSELGLLSAASTFPNFCSSQSLLLPKTLLVKCAIFTVSVCHCIQPIAFGGTGAYKVLDLQYV